MGLMYRLAFLFALAYVVQGQGNNVNVNQLNGLLSDLRNRMLQRMLQNSQQNRANAASSNNIADTKPQFGSSSNVATALNNLRRRQDRNTAQSSNRITTNDQPSSIIQWQAGGQTRNQIEPTQPSNAGIRISIKRNNEVQTALDSSSSNSRQAQSTPNNVQPVSASLATLLRSLGRNGNGVSNAMQNRASPSTSAARPRSRSSSSSASSGSSSISNLATARAMRGQMSDMLDTHLDNMADMAEAGLLGMPGMPGIPGMSGMSMGFPGMSGMSGMTRFGSRGGMGGFNMMQFGAFS